MRAQPAYRAPATAPEKKPIAHVVQPAGRFLAELVAMCAVMCLGGRLLTLVAFQTAAWLGSPQLAMQAPEFSAIVVAACLALPMIAYMAVRGHPHRHNLVMSGTTLAVGVVLAGLLWSGAIRGTFDSQSLFGLVCAPACLLMIGQMLLSFPMYSGRALHHNRAR